MNALKYSLVNPSGEKFGPYDMRTLVVWYRIGLLDGFDCEDADGGLDLAESVIGVLPVPEVVETKVSALEESEGPFDPCPPEKQAAIEAAKLPFADLPIFEQLADLAVDAFQNPEQFADTTDGADDLAETPAPAEAPAPAPPPPPPAPPEVKEQPKEESKAKMDAVAEPDPEPVAEGPAEDTETVSESAPEPVVPAIPIAPRSEPAKQEAPVEKKPAEKPAKAPIAAKEAPKAVGPSAEKVKPKEAAKAKDKSSPGAAMATAGGAAGNLSSAPDAHMNIFMEGDVAAEVEEDEPYNPIKKVDGRGPGFTIGVIVGLVVVIGAIAAVAIFMTNRDAMTDEGEGDTYPLPTVRQAIPETPEPAPVEQPVDSETVAPPYLQEEPSTVLPVDAEAESEAAIESAEAVAEAEEAVAPEAVEVSAPDEAVEPGPSGATEMEPTETPEADETPEAEAAVEADMAAESETPGEVPEGAEGSLSEDEETSAVDDSGVEAETGDDVSEESEEMG